MLKSRLTIKAAKFSVTISLTTEDRCTPEGGATVAKLASDTSLVGLIGSSCSDETVGGIAAITNSGLTTISPSNTRPLLSDPARGPDYAGYLRTAHSDAFQGKAVAEFAYNFLKVTKAATLHDGSAYAEALQQVFADEFVKLGGTIVAQEAVAKDATDMKPVLTTISAAGPELLYYPVFVAVGGFVTAQIRDVAGLEDVKIIGSDGIFTADLLKGGGANTEGMYLSSPDFSAFTGDYAGFIAKHEAKYGGSTLSTFHAHAYDATNILFAALEKVAVVEADGTITPRTALREPSSRPKTSRCHRHRPARPPATAARPSSRSRNHELRSRFLGSNFRDCPESQEGLSLSRTSSKLHRGGRRESAPSLHLYVRRQPMRTSIGERLLDLAVSGVLWGFRILIVAGILIGTIATIRAGKYTSEQWIDFVVFGISQGSIYALIALGYTMVYGILRMINFAHGDIFMTGAFAGYFLATWLNGIGFIDNHPILGLRS